MSRLKIAILYGGKSFEHEVSLLSTKNIISALNRKKYEPMPIKIEKDGLFDISNLLGVDVAISVLHGVNGEDGVFQGFLKTLGIPFVGAGVLGSAVGMDKDVMKRLLREAKIPVTNFIVAKRGDLLNFAKIKKVLGLPLFIKPANAGSSIGTTKIRSESEFVKGVREALKYDNKILIEKAISGREIEVSVLGNESPIASLPGEVIPSDEFYTYEAKYIDENGARLEIPAKLTKKETKELQKVAIDAYKTLCCEGLGRVDMFLKETGEVLVNEINTLPGFTDISMYPKLWEVSGISIPQLIDKLIKLALHRHKRDAKLKLSYV